MGIHTIHRKFNTTYRSALHLFKIFLTAGRIKKYKAPLYSITGSKTGPYTTRISQDLRVYYTRAPPRKRKEPTIMAFRVCYNYFLAFFRTSVISYLLSPREKAIMRFGLVISISVISTGESIVSLNCGRY